MGWSIGVKVGSKSLRKFPEKEKSNKHVEKSLVGACERARGSSRKRVAGKSWVGKALPGKVERKGGCKEVLKSPWDKKGCSTQKKKLGGNNLGQWGMGRVGAPQ